MRSSKILIILVAILAICTLTYFGLQDKQDPFWEALDELVVKEYQTLDKSALELQKLYEEVHEKEVNINISALALISEPFLPTMEFSKFQKYFHHLKTHRLAMISGVTGVGSTTLTESIAKIIVPKADHRMEIICAPQFDLILHKEFIGEVINRQFQKGKLLQFWDRCLANPKETFLLVIDDFDKINPETFFGPELWRKLDNRKFKVVKGEKEIIIPDNFYMIMTVHSGEGARIELNNEHFKRLGGKMNILPEFKEMIIYLQDKQKELTQQLAKISTNSPEKVKLENQLKALSDTDNLKRHIYFFKKMNDLIANDFSINCQIGPWNNIRKLYQPEDFEEVKHIFKNHVNALSSNKDLTDEAMIPILYTIKTNGRIQGSNTIATWFKILEEKGFLTEFLVGLSFILISGLISWYLLRKKLRYVNIYTQKVYDLTKAFNDGAQSYENVSQQFTEIKREVDDLVIKQDINYTEAVFFYNFIEDRAKRIELVRSVNENFETLVEPFLEDGHLEEKEYQRLLQYLENIRHKITKDDFARYKEKIKSLYLEFN